ncbi:hypothetical protein LTR95_017658 [Oleoguttula sp. CCFEE 5521]
MVHGVDGSSEGTTIYGQPTVHEGVTTITYDNADHRGGPLAVVQGSPMVESSADELAALSIVLGIEVQIDRPYQPGGRGGFGYLLLSNMSRGLTVIRLLNHRSPRSTVRHRARNVHSTLLAKHMACGCMPFASTESGETNKTLAVTPTVDRAIRDGLAINDCYNEDWRWDQLAAAARIIDYFANPFTPMQGRSESTAGTYWVQAGRQAGKSLGLPDECSWSSSVAHIAFGGLVPMAAGQLVDLVAFSVGSVVDSRDIEALDPHMIDAVDDEVQRRTGAKNLRLFGDRTERHALAKKTGIYLDSTSLMSHAFHSTSRDVMAQLALYTTLLEALLAMVHLGGKASTQHGDDFLKHGKAQRDAVYEACAEQIRQAYIAKVFQHDYRHPSIASLLGSPLDELRHTHQLSPESCGTVARCIVMAWTHFVRRIASDHESTRPTSVLQSTAARSSSQQEKSDAANMVGLPPYRPPPLDELPDIAMWE